MKDRIKPLDEFLDDIFHSCALTAYAEVARESGQMPPNSEEVRKRAYRLFEEEKRKYV